MVTISRPLVGLLPCGAALLAFGCNVILGYDEGDPGHLPTTSADGGTSAGGSGGSSTGGSGAGGAGGGGFGGQGGSPATPLRVFISSATPTGALGGPFQADALCNSLAAGSLLTQGNNVWTAWLSTSTVPAIDRIYSDATWLDTQGRTIFVGRARLIDGVGPSTLLQLDEQAHVLPVGEPVWTGTAADGDPTYQDCSAWQTGDSGADGTVGAVAMTGGGWTNASLASCGTPARLYCFEQVPR